MTTTKLASFMDAANKPEEAPSVPFTVADNKGQAHKLTFVSGRCRNFRAVGDNWIDIDFLASQSTLVASDDNGAGKSTLNVWLPYYVITGKPYGEKEKVTALVNTINNKAMVCELIFSINGTVYKVIRGRKPDIFEIRTLVDGDYKLIQDDAGSKDWQDYLYSLLGLDKKNGPKLIENIIILGKDKFKPFIEMGAEDRRTMVETIWDLGVFSNMNEVAKASRKKADGERDDKGLELYKFEQELDKQVSLIEARKRNRDDLITAFDSALATSRLTAAQLQEQYNKDTQAKTDEKPYRDEFERVCAGLDSETKKLESGLEQELEALETERADAQEVCGKATAACDDDIAKANGDLGSIVAKLEAIAEQEIEDIHMELDAAEKELETKRSEQTGILDLLPTFDKQLTDARSLVESHAAAIEAARQGVAQFQGYESRFNDKISDLQKRLDNYNEMGVCPSCNQQVTDEAKQGVADDLEPKIKQFQDKLGEVERNLEDHNNALGAATESHKQSSQALQDLQSEISSASSKAQSVKADIIIAEREVKGCKDRVVTVEENLKKDIANARNAAQNLVNAANQRRADAIATRDRTLNGFDGRVQQANDRVTARKHAMDDEWIAADKRMKDGIAASDKNLREASERSAEHLARHNSSMENDQKLHDEGLAKIDDDIQFMEDGAAKIRDAISEGNEQYNAITADIKDWDNILVLISDKEGKADIIRQYLPFLNSKINEYCESLGLFINFAMDDKFGVAMNAVDRKNQSLYSLSTGQRARVNLAILFALRDVANLKASIQTNLLVLDEVLENLSEQGALEATTMIKTKFPSSNLFVVTQRESEFSEYFDAKIKYGLRDGFTTVLAND
ncbi:hypothetical protein MYOV003v1_p0169 [Vibrio phage 207E48.1]|nr:hypothetical protein MYOV003v1_p0169 [Vibrio phage 207E48.1]